MQLSRSQSNERRKQNQIKVNQGQAKKGFPNFQNENSSNSRKLGAADKLTNCNRFSFEKKNNLFYGIICDETIKCNTTIAMKCGQNVEFNIDVNI